MNPQETPVETPTTQPETPVTAPAFDIKAALAEFKTELSKEIDEKVKALQPAEEETPPPDPYEAMRSYDPKDVARAGAEVGADISNQVNLAIMQADDDLRAEFPELGEADYRRIKRELLEAPASDIPNYVKSGAHTRMAKMLLGDKVKSGQLKIEAPPVPPVVTPAGSAAPSTAYNGAVAEAERRLGIKFDPKTQASLAAEFGLGGFN